MPKNQPVCMCKEGVCRIREGGLSGWGWGELSEILIASKVSEIENRGGDKSFKKEWGNLGQGVGALKREVKSNFRLSNQRIFLRSISIIF